MNIKRHAVALSAIALCISGSVLASEIYKWTDANGDIHYGDRPSGDPTEQRMHITYKRTDNSAVQARVASRREGDAMRREAAEERAGAKQTEEELRAEREERNKKCTDYRAKLETLVTSRRLYREDENGEREYLDDTQRQEARQRAEELVAEYCGS